MRKIYDSPTRLYILSLGRKNGKTTFIAMLLLLHLCGPESLPNTQLYSAAQSREQAAVVFNYAAKMVRMSPNLEAYMAVKDSAKMLVCPERGTVYRALSAEATTAFGLNPAFAIHDELGQVVGPTSTLYDAIESAQGAQESPLSVVISTQAATDADLLSMLIDDALLGIDPEVKIDLYTAPLELEDGKHGPKLDPFSDRALRLANPHFDVFMNRKEVRKVAAKAKRMPTSEASYRNLVLNQRVSQHTALIPRATWEICSGAIDEDAFRSRPVYLGLDLSARNDLTSMCAAVEDAEGIVHVKLWFWAPEYGLMDRVHRDRAPYDVFHRDGWLTLTPGPTVDYEYVARNVVTLSPEMPLAELAFDRWRIDLFKAELSKLGFLTRDSLDDLNGGLLMTKFGQGFVDMAPAIDEVESLFADERVRHGGNPLLRWQSWNAIVTKNPAGDRKLDKSKTTGRIDGMVAMTMAIGRLRAAKKPGKSFWETGEDSDEAVAA